MIYTFKETKTQQTWMLDTEKLIWSKVSNLVLSPSIIAAETNLANYAATESGTLTSFGGGRYVLEGRRPFDENNQPQLSIFILFTTLLEEDGGTCVTLAQANVEIENLQHQKINKFHTQTLSPIQLNPKGTKGVGKLCIVPPVNENVNTK